MERLDKVAVFFHEMLEEANDIFDMEIHGSVAVEIFSMKAQGMVMILTITETELDKEELLSEGFLEMQVTVEETVDILYEFTDIEYVIDAVKQLEQNNFKGGSLYNLNERYYLCFVDISSFKEEQIIAILSEFGEVSLKSIYIIEEYGNVIKKDNAIETLVHFFNQLFLR